jgi:hypothetical protein
LFKDLSVFIIRLQIFEKKLKHQGNVIVDNKQVNVVANEEEIKMEQIIIIYILTLESKP